MKVNPKTDYYQEIVKIAEAIKSDFGGGSSLAKSFIMGYLALTFELKTYVEIGVYRGRSLLPVAAAFKRNNGMSYGIDPYLLEEAKEYDVDEDLGNQITSFLEDLKFDDVYKDVLRFSEKFELTRHVELIRKTSQDAAFYFKEENIAIDMLHIDGNHDTKNVQMDIDNYLPLMKDGSMIVFDDINWPSVQVVYNEVKKKYVTLFESETFGVLIKQPKTQNNVRNAELLRLKLGKTYNKINAFEISSESKEEFMPTICVGVITYNHEKYITECLEGIVSQTGNFRLKIVIYDDNSLDKTTEIIEEYIRNYSGTTNISFTLIKNHENIGVTKNFEQCVYACDGADYFAFCEGDDYWNVANKLQLQMTFLRNNPQCSICFNSITLYFDEDDRYELFEEQQGLQDVIFSTKDLIKSYFIGNLSCCFYDAKYIKDLPASLFENLFIGDWMFNIYYSQFGDIGFIKKPLSIYRKHSGGNWALIKQQEQCERLIKYVDEYNEYLNFDYDKEFTEHRKKLTSSFAEKFNIVIVDDCFPHPISGFRYQEFKSYFEKIDSIKILTSGASVGCLGNQTIEELIIDYKRAYPKFARHLETITNFDNVSCDVLYFVFLGNAFTYLNLAESKNIPFVFTLYPGGYFALNNPTSDMWLRRVVNSRCFRKVIVTQQVTYDYLIENKFCTPEQIEYIFGVVIPLEKLEKEYTDKKNYGFEKDRLDICFVAHKYTLLGEDKGYDVFIEVAKLLCETYSNIYFHVVGNFDKQVIDISSIEEKITFYGVQKQDWFDEFYKDKDIILSPNIPGKIKEGSFDGFPTASCTDAGLRKVAIFCTDQLGLNKGHFTEGEEIVIIEYDIAKITDSLAYYYENPDKLKAICEQGCSRIKDIYSYEKQIQPRIDLLLKERETSIISAETLGKSIHTEIMLSNDLSSKIYIDTGSNFNEEETVVTQNYYHNPMFSLSFDIEEYKSIRSIRWDPVEGQFCKVKITSVLYVDSSGENLLDLQSIVTNGTMLEDGFVLFATMDPMFFLSITGEVKALIIQGEWYGVDAASLYKNCMEQLKVKNEELTKIACSKSWKITKPLRMLAQIMRKKAI